MRCFPKPKDLTGHLHLPHTNLSCKLSLIDSGLELLNIKAADKKRLVFRELAADIMAPIAHAYTTLCQT